MSYSVSTVTKRKLIEDANGQPFEIGLAAMLNRNGHEVVAVSISDQSVTVVCHHSATKGSDKK